ncbi:MAG: class I SAM-dependent methyltransferase [Spirochaetales bacterium]|nr:MAG: class I SAM-dependent methyltransferase [Spirochaetales bacterium]
MGEWFADEEFWTAYAPLLFDERRWSETPMVVDGIEKLTGLASGERSCKSVLDLCCGPGRHVLEFARRGYRVCGVDSTKPYLQAARESAAAEGLSVELVCEDARRFSRPGSFDLAVNLFTSFGYFDDPADDALMVRRLYENLAPDGALVMEMAGKETAARDFTEGEWFERDGKLVMTEFSVVGAWEGLRNRWIMVDGDRRVDRSWVQRLYAATELKILLLQAGFRTVRVYGSFEGTPYDSQARSLVTIGIK